MLPITRLTAPDAVLEQIAALCRDTLEALGPPLGSADAIGSLKMALATLSVIGDSADAFKNTRPVRPERLTA